MLAGHDTLGLLPTGGGKSVCFQVPALAFDGLTIVVTPLISLMKDQVDNLRQVGVNAVFIHTGLSRREVSLAYDRCRLGVAKMLYVSPERVQTERFIAEMRQWDVSLIVVDEAHCISQWGYDFRPSYLATATVRQYAPDAPVLALTASATPEVVDDIRLRLEFRPGHQSFARSFARDNISFLVRRGADKIGTLEKILSNTSGSAIVYVRSRRKTAEIASALQQMGFTADFYHAGLRVEDKNDRQNSWKNGDTRVIVATNAFGMGIDKGDVRTVVHYDLPSSLEEYYQEAGRAGRDGKPAYAVVLASSADKATLRRRLTDAFPPREFIAEVYDKLCVYLDVAVGAGYECVYPFEAEAFCRRYSLESKQTRSALTLLTQAGYIDYCEDVHLGARVTIVADKRELYNLQVSAEADRVLQGLLRNYSGLFADYIGIDETWLANDLLLTPDTVYQSLLELQRAKVLHYIPRSETPYVRFVTSREESRYLVISRDIYELRRERMAARLEAMSDFVFDEDSCRVQRMLSYFGQQSAPCGKCDYCRMQRTIKTALSDNEALKRLRAFTSTHGRWDIAAASEATGVCGQQLDRCLQILTDNEKIAPADHFGREYRTI